MVDPRLSAVLERARSATPPVRAAALFHIARIARSSEILDEAWNAVRPLAGLVRSEIAAQGWLITAEIDPGRITPAVAGRFDDYFLRGSLALIVETMLRNGGDAAVALAILRAQEHWDPDLLRAIRTVGEWCDDRGRRDLVRLAAERWRPMRVGNDFDFGADSAFRDIFKWGWRYLPEEEARELASAVVAAIDQTAEGHVSSTLDPEGRHVLQGRACFYFDIIDALQVLDPAGASRLASKDDRLRSALERYPRGMTSVHEEAELRMREHQPSAGQPGAWFVMGGGDDDFEYITALHETKTLAGFAEVMQFAERKLAADTDERQPNGAAKEFWPSVNRYRQILDTAARRLGSEADALLDRIPDADARLLAEIEMIAGIRGVAPVYMSSHIRPAHSGPVVAEPGIDIGNKTNDRGGGPAGPRIRCPKCRWEPREGDVWACTCGHVWNTFDTGGVCPNCLRQWTETQCLRCQEFSPHSDWYGED